MCACLCVCACVCVCRGFPIKVEVTLSILLLFCQFLVIFLSIGLCPFMMNYPEFFLLFSLLKMSLVFGFSRCVFHCSSQRDRQRDKKKKKTTKNLVELQILALKSIHTNTCSKQPPQLRANQHPRHTCENRCL